MRWAPTGAISKRPNRARPLPLHAEEQSTVCVLCSHNCGIRVDVEDGAISKIRPDERNPITEGYSCNKAFSVHHYARHGQRVTEPLERQTDGLVQADHLGRRDFSRWATVEGDRGRAWRTQLLDRRCRWPSEPHGGALRAGAPHRVS